MLLTRIRKWLWKLRVQGFWFTVINQVSHRRGKQSLFRKKLAGNVPWLYGRATGTDEWVYQQVFDAEEYGIVPSDTEVKVIIDGGANVGYTSVYFAIRFPGAKVIAIEPDPDNYAILLLNVDCYENIIPLNAAVWGKSGYISMAEDTFRDGGAWAKTVSPNSGSVKAYTIDEVMHIYHHQGKSIVKLDIEGAETHVFQNGPSSWLKNCSYVVMEIHTDSEFGDPTSLIHYAINQLSFTMQSRGELVLFSRP